MEGAVEWWGAGGVVWSCLTGLSKYVSVVNCSGWCVRVVKSGRVATCGELC